jgi:hypothetical protein
VSHAPPCRCPNPRAQECWRDRASLDAARRILESAIRNGRLNEAAAQKWLTEQERLCSKEVKP